MAGGCGDGWRRYECRRMTVTVLCTLLLLFLPLNGFGQAEGSMDITAFEYFRKFGKHLELGECPQRELLITLPNNSTIVKQETCTARQKGNITSVPRELNDTRHVIIPTANDLVAYLGLCGGEAASYLGILNNGDCVAVDIASKLSFNKKTMIRAYVEYYRQSLDILDSATASIRPEFLHYVADKFYVKNRSYGTLEFILVQFRFRSRNQTDMAKNLKMTSNLMSEYMKKLEREVGRPRKLMVLSLSTAIESTYNLDRYDERDWGNAVRNVVLRELTMAQTRGRIASGHIRSHLNYQLYPFDEKKEQTYRLINPLTWEATSMLEVSLRVSLGIAKKATKRCRKNKSKLCRRMRELRRKLMRLQAEIHKGRSNWMSMTSQEQQKFAASYDALVAMHSRFTKTLSRSVRQMKKQEKLEQFSERKRRRNQVPLTRRSGRLNYRSYRTRPPRVRRRRQ